MESMMGLINLEHEHHVFNELTYFRSSASLPFGGRYRLIDFALSNMVNSNVQEVAVFVRNKYRSLLDHLGTGENWDLDRRYGGLFVLPPDWNDPTDKSQGDLRFFHNNRDYFDRSTSQYVLISGSQFISNTDYKEAFRQHLEHGAEVTLITTVVDDIQPEHYPYSRVESGREGWVEQITGDQRNQELFTGVYIINKDVLMELVDECIAYSKDNFFEHGIRSRINELKVRKFEQQGYSAFINTIESFYRQNMNLLSKENYSHLFLKENLVRTKISNNPPVKYKSSASVANSLLANGCEIGGTVEGSILFRGVRVKEGATVKNSIIMQRCTIEEGVHLENVILDKDVYVSRNQKMMGSSEKPYVVAKRQVI